MAEHLHGYPRCETAAGAMCDSSDLNWEECKNHGALRACEASVVDGIPTGQYRCLHDDAAPKKAAVKARIAKAVAKRKVKKAVRKAKRKVKKVVRKAKRSNRRAVRRVKRAVRKAKRGAARKK